MMMWTHCVILALLSGFGVAAAQLKEQEVKPLAIGEKAPDFTLPGVDGKEHSLASFAQADYLLVIFTCNHCPDARAARERINDFAKNYAEKGVAVVAISGNDPQALMKWELGWSVYGDSFEEMKEVAKEHDYVFPYLYDGETQETTLAYGALATPHCFLFGPERTLLYQGQFDNGRRNFGPPEKATVELTVKALLAGEPVPAETSRVFGCSTKWQWKRELAEKKRAEWRALPVEVADLDLATAKKLAENKTEKIRVINFWSTSCGPCIAEFPDLVDAYQRYQNRAFELITIAVEGAQNRPAVEKFLKDQHLPLSPRTRPSVEAEGRKTNNYHYAGSDLDALAEAIDPQWQGPLPHTLIIAPGGEVIFRHSNQVDPIKLRRAIVKQLVPEE
ncbi:MAG: redoxin domain-containing protein [Verrucomicrobiales bacterium]